MKKLGEHRLLARTVGVSKPSCAPPYRNDACEAVGCLLSSWQMVVATESSPKEGFDVHSTDERPTNAKIITKTETW